MVREDVRTSSTTLAKEPEAVAVAVTSPEKSNSIPRRGWNDGPPSIDELRLFGVWSNVTPLEPSPSRMHRTVEFDPDGTGKCACRTQSDQWQGAWRLSATSDASGWHQLKVEGKDIAEIRFLDEEKFKLRPVGTVTRKVDELGAKLPDGIWNNEDPGKSLRRTDEAESKEITFWRCQKWSGGLSSGLPDGTWTQRGAIEVEGQRFDRFVQFIAGVRQPDAQ